MEIIFKVILTLVLLFIIGLGLYTVYISPETEREKKHKSIRKICKFCLWIDIIVVILFIDFMWIN